MLRFSKAEQNKSSVAFWRPNHVLLLPIWFSYNLFERSWNPGLCECIIYTSVLTMYQLLSLIVWNLKFCCYVSILLGFLVSNYYRVWSSCVRVKHSSRNTGSLLGFSVEECLHKVTDMESIEPSEDKIGNCLLLYAHQKWRHADEIQKYKRGRMKLILDSWMSNELKIDRDKLRVRWTSRGTANTWESQEDHTTCPK